MGENLEAILLRLGLDASGFTKGAREAKKELGVLEKGVGSLKGEMSALAAQVAAGVGFAVLVSEAMQFAEAVTKVSEQTGLSVEAVQFLRFAADQTGTSVDALADTVNKLQRQLVAAGEDDKLRVRLEELVGPIENLRAMQPEQQLQKVAEAIASIHVPAERTAAAVTLLGKSGADAIPEMVALAEKQDELNAAFERTGGAVSADAIAKVEGMGDAIGETKTAVVALATELLAKVAPAFTAFLQTVTSVVGGLRLLDGEGDNAMVNFDNKVLQAIEHLEYLKKMNPYAQQGSFAAELIAKQEELVKKLKEEQDLRLGFGVAGAKQAKEQLALTKMLRDMEEENSAALTRSLTDQQAINDHFGEIRFDTALTEEENLAQMRTDVHMRLQRRLVDQADATHKELLEKETEFSEEVMKVSDTTGGTKIAGWKMETYAALDLASQLTSGVATQNKKMFELNKALGLADTVVNTSSAIMKAWANPGFPMAIPLTAVIAAAGAAQMQAIAGAKFGGGSRAPSAAASSAPAAAAAGDSGGGGGGGGGRVMRVEGITAGSLVTGSMVRQIADAIGDHVRDGGRVEWAS